ncbi:MAG: hypothetical protein ACYC9J_06580 [Sulfuricaulis sp.]
MSSDLFMLVLLFLFLTRVRLYARTGLRGELVVALGLAVMLATPLIGHLLWVMTGQTFELIIMIFGFVIGNVGLLISVTFERERRRELFEGVRLLDKLLGNVPRVRGQRTTVASPTKEARKSLWVGAWIAALLASLFWSRAHHQPLDFLPSAVLGLMAVWYIGYWLWTKRK